MSDLSVALICGTCSHDWIQDLNQIETFKVFKRSENQFVKVYRVPCSICGHILMVETDAGADDIPTAWGT